MQSLEAPIIAAVIVGFVTLLTVGVNVWSARIARKEDRLEKRSEWLKEKQMKDVEEIIPTLSAFLNDISTTVEKMNKKEQAALRDIHNVVKGKEVGKSVDSLPSQSIVRMADANKEEMATLLELHSKRESWFAFESKRLTIWFQDEEVEKTLSTIGWRFRNYHLNIYQAFASFQHFADKKSTATVEIDGRYSRPERFDEFVNPAINIVQGDEVEANKYYRSFRDATSNWADLYNLVIEFQKALIDRYKLDSPYQASKHTDDGLLVSVARQVEKGVRWLLRLEQANKPAPKIKNSAESAPAPVEATVEDKQHGLLVRLAVKLESLLGR